MEAGRELNRICEDLFKSVLELSSNGYALNDIVFEVDEDFVFSEVFISNENLLFATSQRIIGSRINETFPQDMTDLFISQFEKARITGNKQTITYKSSLASDNKWYKADIYYSETGLKNKYIINTTKPIAINNVSSTSRIDFLIFLVVSMAIAKEISLGTSFLICSILL